MSLPERACLGHRLNKPFGPATNLPCQPWSVTFFAMNLGL
jgi:hypothetical protein